MEELSRPWSRYSFSFEDYLRACEIRLKSVRWNRTHIGNLASHISRSLRAASWQHGRRQRALFSETSPVRKRGQRYERKAYIYYCGSCSHELSVSFYDRACTGKEWSCNFTPVYRRKRKSSFNSRPSHLNKNISWKYTNIRFDMESIWCRGYGE